ncbi:hypothetical protein [Bacillus cereus]|uniref:hypothetical protein n=1 Tax=Bacillus cereus TaxID=1396 RepID=UPI00159BAF97|nr:hypothetical protein [Bacillus cereus]
MNLKKKKQQTEKLHNESCKTECYPIQVCEPTTPLGTHECHVEQNCHDVCTPDVDA